MEFPFIITLLMIFIRTHQNILPGLSEKYYKKGDPINLSIGKLNSVITQIPFEYYYLPFCQPKEVIKRSDNLGEILTGDYTSNSLYEINMLTQQQCKLLCTSTFSEHEIDLFYWMVDREYKASWYIDDLPAAYEYFDDSTEKTAVSYEDGFPIGRKTDENQYFINNHLKLIIFYHDHAQSMKQINYNSIVGFSIEPQSIESENGVPPCGEETDFRKINHQAISRTKNNITFTYDVEFKPSNIKWASRWDFYLLSANSKNQAQIHWESITSASIVTVVFSIIVVYIFTRAIKKDIEFYNISVNSDDFIDDNSWKQQCNDVFRKPKNSMLLCAMIGTGMQLFSMLLIVLVFTCLGFVSPANRGMLLTVMVLLFVFLGVFAGYYSSRFYKMFQGTNWLKNSLLTATFFPCLAFSIFILINFFLWMEESSGTVHFQTIIALLLLWVCCQSPLVLIGSFIGLKKKVIRNPCKVNPVPTRIPEQPWYLEYKYIILISGILPFLAIFIEYIYIVSSIWRHYFYYLFGFLLIVVIIMVITCSEISIIITYLQLNKGNYNWWWKSYFISGSVAFYTFFYSVYYYLTQMEISRLSSTVIYFGYMGLMTFTIFLVAGTVGFIATYGFLRKIYSMIKID